MNLFNDSSPDVHIMLDIETLGTKPGCKLLSIGATTMFTRAPTHFTLRASVKSQDFYELAEDPVTLLWWGTKSQDAQDDAFGGVVDIKSVLIQFYDWLSYLGYTQTGGKLYVWAKSPSFDCSILRDISERVGLEVPWSFRNELDVRTIAAIFPLINVDPTGVKHSALADAINQASLVEKCIHSISLVQGKE